jgi:hypothetical protein
LKFVEVEREFEPTAARGFVFQQQKGALWENYYIFVGKFLDP